MEVKFNLSNTENKELVSYCNLNDLLVSEVIKKSFTTGFNIERYGLLSEGAQVVEKVVEKIVEKRIEVPVEIIKEVVKIEYVEIEKPVEVVKIEYIEVEKPIEIIKEVIKEIPVEKIVEVERYIKGDSNVVEIIKEIEKIVEVEVIKEVEKIVEVEVIKEVIIEKEPDNSKVKALEQTLHKLKSDNIEKDKKVKELEKTIENIQFNQSSREVTYLKGSNLSDRL
jgi:hypothetical protein